MLGHVLRMALVGQLLAGAACRGGEVPPAQPTVALAEVVRGQVTVTRDGRAEGVRRSARVEHGATVTTSEGDGRASARLDGGAWLLLGPGSDARLEPARVHLDRGLIWLDAGSAEETTVETAAGTVAASGAALSLEVEGAAAVVYCASGEISLRTQAGSGRLRQGETARLVAGASPEVQPAALWDDWTGGLADPAASIGRAQAAVGVLAGRQLGRAGEARVPMSVRRHEVRIAFEGDLATTEVVQTFFNGRSETLEAEYAIRLPRDAIVTGFSVAQGSGQLVEAGVCTLATADDGQPHWAEWEHSPSALAPDGPDRLRARVYPVAPGGTVRVRLTYSEWLDRAGSLRSYVYPMGVEGEPPLLGELSIEADLSRAGARVVRAGLGARVEARRVSLRRSDFRPRADFHIDLVGEEAADASALAYVVDAPAGVEGEDAGRYALVDVPTSGLEGAATELGPTDLVLLVDVSGGTHPEELEVARAVVEATLRQLAPYDRVALLLADVTAHAPAGLPAELREATPAAREALLEALSRVGLGGATDLASSLVDAAVLVAGRPRGAVVYVGDGVPTTGRLDPTSIREALSVIESPPRLFAVGIGEGADMALLGSVFGRDAHSVAERTAASRTMMRILAEASQPTLRGVAVDLGPTMERVYPSTALVIPEGDRLRLSARLEGPPPTQVTVRGTRSGEPFVRVVPLVTREVGDAGAGFVRRRWARARAAELVDRDAPAEVLAALGARFDVVTPWNALVVGAPRGCRYQPLRGFDRGPVEALAGRGRARVGPGAPGTAVEAAWSERVRAVAPSRDLGGGGEALARLAIERAMAEGARGPSLCFERRQLARPELAGELTVRVEVDGSGAPREARLVRSTLADPVVERCVLAEVRGISFPVMGGERTVAATHTYQLAVAARDLGSRRVCSEASRQSLAVRRWLWWERLQANPGVEGTLAVYREADEKCELGSWAARRTLLDMALRQVPELTEQVRFLRAFGEGSSVAAHLKRVIMLSARTPADVALVRNALGLDPSVPWDAFAYAWHSETGTSARLALVRRWLEAVPGDMDLRLRLLGLLETSGATGEARRLARELQEDPFADARARALLGEFWLRQDEVAEARRAISGIIEHAPRDPWAHQRVGDLYLASGWGEGAYREYATLARLRPDDPSTLLRLARAAAAAGRVDEALRLEQRLSESVAPGASEGVGALARLWTAVRLARLRAEAGEDETLRAAVGRRERASGLLRDRPALFAALSWENPDHRLELHVGYPSAPAHAPWTRAAQRGGEHGIEALRLGELEEGEHRFEVRRAPGAEDREVVGELLVVVMPGSPQERVSRLEVRLPPDRAVRRFRLPADGPLTPLAE